MAPVANHVLHQVTEGFIASLQFLGEVLARQAGSSLSASNRSILFHLFVEGDVIDVTAKFVVTFLVDEPLSQGDVQHRLVQLVHLPQHIAVHLCPRFAVQLTGRELIPASNKLIHVRDLAALVIFQSGLPVQRHPHQIAVQFIAKRLEDVHHPLGLGLDVQCPTVIKHLAVEQQSFKPAVNRLGQTRLHITKRAVLLDGTELVGGVLRNALPEPILHPVNTVKDGLVLCKEDWLG